MAIAFTQTDMQGSIGRVTRIKVAALFAASDTNGTHTFTRPFRAAPQLVGMVRKDDIVSIIMPRVSALSATAMTVLAASATGDENAEFVLEGELA